MHNVSEVLIGEQSMTSNDLLGFLLTVDLGLPKDYKHEVKKLDLVLNDKCVICPIGGDELIPPALCSPEALLFIIEVQETIRLELSLNLLDQLEVLFEDANLEIENGCLGHLYLLEVGSIIHH